VKDLQALWDSGERNASEFSKVLKVHGDKAAKMGL